MTPPIFQHIDFDSYVFISFPAVFSLYVPFPCTSSFSRSNPQITFLFPGILTAALLLLERLAFKMFPTFFTCSNPTKLQDTCPMSIWITVHHWISIRICIVFHCHLIALIWITLDEVSCLCVIVTGL